MNTHSLIQSKIFTSKQFLKKLQLWRFKDQKVVFTNGCFDLLHQGHIHYLMQTADLGDKLIIGLNSNASVKRLKGNSRPLQDEQARAEILASLQYVAAVVIFEEDTPLKLIQLCQPDVLVKGGDYQKHQIVGAGFVEQGGGEVVIIPFLEGHSTTNLIEKMED